MTTRPSVDRVWASQAASSNIQDPDTYVPNKVTTGWEAEIPPFQWFNWIQNRNDLFKLALAERGVAEWGTDVTYKSHSLAYHNGHIWICQDENKAVEPIQGSVWNISSAEITQKNLDDLKARIEQHIARTNNPHNVTAAQVGAYSKSEADTLIQGQQADLTQHESDYNNPHKVTAVQVGGVPITGGTYTGTVDIESDTLTISKGKTSKPFSLVRSGEDIFISTTDNKLGIKGGKPVFVDGATDNELLYTGNFKALKDKYEPLYRVPTPDFYMPLTCDINIYEGGGTTSFSRASTATYVNKAGVLVSASIDEPRFEKEGLLMEGASTNLVPRSITDGESLGWIPNGGIVSTKQVSPDGGNNALKIVAPAMNNGIFTFVGARTKESTISVWLKGERGGEHIMLGFDSTAGVAVLTTDWKRFSFKMPPTENESYTIYPANGCTYYVFAAQVEELPFATSYIPTNGAAATRVADSFYVDAEILTLKPNEYTLHCESSNNSLSGLSTIFRQGSYSNLVGIINKDNTVGHFGLYGSFTGAISTTTINKDVLRYTLCNPDLISTQLYLNGSLDATSNIPSNIPLDGRFFLGSAFDGTQSLFGHIKNFKVWNEVLTPEQISTL